MCKVFRYSPPLPSENIAEVGKPAMMGASHCDGWVVKGMPDGGYR
jgi:hypothetical protein